MRIVVVGTSGAGKSTLARSLAGRFAVPHIELDAINWQPGWRALAAEDPPEFARRVDIATAAVAWVADGNYGSVRPLLWGRATHLVWLDYSRAVVMRRVLRRSLHRAVAGTALWAGNREDWRRLFRASHPIRWAWQSWTRVRAETASLLADPQFAHLRVLRPASPRALPGAIAALDAAASRAMTAATRDACCPHPPAPRA